MVSQMAGFASSRAFRAAGRKAFAEAGLKQRFGESRVDLMAYGRTQRS
jgi:hypothetical protein